mgnify:CR=1 FL=1
MIIILILLIIAPLNFIGISLGKILPDDKSFYLNNIILIQKIITQIQVSIQIGVLHALELNELNVTCLCKT